MAEDIFSQIKSGISQVAANIQSAAAIAQEVQRQVNPQPTTSTPAPGLDGQQAEPAAVAASASADVVKVKRWLTWGAVGLAVLLMVVFAMRRARRK